MKNIRLNKGSVDLPECWNDLTPKQYIFSVGELLKLISGQIDEFNFRFNLLLHYTRYKPAKRNYDSKRWLRFYLFLCRGYRSISYRCRLLLGGLHKKGYQRYMEAIKKRYTYKNPEESTREIIAFNLVRLADELSFPLNGLLISLLFKANPIPAIKGLGAGKKFDIGIHIITDFRAGEFFDAIDTAAAWRATKNENLLNMLVAMLYPSSREHTLDGVQKTSLRVANKLSYTVKYAAYLWFCSIPEYFCNHPVYSLLYGAKKENSASSKISLGSGASIIHLSKKGFGSHDEMRNKNLIEFMDIQVSDLQTYINDLIGTGVKPIDICRKTSLTLAQIQQLSS